MQPIEELIAELCEVFAGDPTAPSVVLSHVGGKGWYASVVRYTVAVARGKSVVCSAFGSSLARAVCNAHHAFRASDAFLSHEVAESEVRLVPEAP